MNIIFFFNLLTICMLCCNVPVYADAVNSSAHVDMSMSILVAVIGTLSGVVGTYVFNQFIIRPKYCNLQEAKLNKLVEEKFKMLSQEITMYKNQVKEDYARKDLIEIKLQTLSDELKYIRTKLDLYFQRNGITLPTEQKERH